MRHYRIRCALFFIATVIFIADAHAGAWTQARGRAQIILTQSYYATDRYWDNQGHKQPQLLYGKYDLNPYMEYGLLDGVTVGANLSLQRAGQNVAGGTLINYGLGDSEFFARLRFLQHGNFVFSAEPLVKLPSPESANSVPKLGSSHPDAGMGLNAGYGFGSGDRRHFADMHLEYRHRFGDRRDQVKLAATLGYSLSPRWMLLPQFFYTKRRNAPRIATFTQSSADDYDLGKPQLSVVYRVSKKTNVQAGAFMHATGKNTGAGGGVIFSVWRNF